MAYTHVHDRSGGTLRSRSPETSASDVTSCARLTVEILNRNSKGKQQGRWTCRRWRKQLAAFAWNRSAGPACDNVYVRATFAQCAVPTSCPPAASRPHLISLLLSTTGTVPPPSSLRCVRGGCDFFPLFSIATQWTGSDSDAAWPMPNGCSTS